MVQPNGAAQRPFQPQFPFLFENGFYRLRLCGALTELYASKYRLDLASPPQSASLREIDLGNGSPFWEQSVVAVFVETWS